MDLKGQCAVVTGSTRGIGFAIAKALLKANVNVTISSLHPKNVKRTVTSLAKTSVTKVVGKACDVREPDQVRQLIHFCVKELGGIDILINNAGIGIFETVEEFDMQQWRSVIETNLNGVFYGCHFAIPEMKKRGGGFIINISSLAAKNAFAKGAAYNASKFAVTGLSEALMQEVRHDNIRVAYIMPGSVDTRFNRSPPARKQTWKISPKDVAEVVIETLKRHPRSLTSRIEMRPSRPPRK